MDVSVVIINFNTCEMTSECIDSVIKHTSGIEYEIILVDNASTDGSREFFKDDSRVTYVYNETNRGFGAGNNLGVKYASGKYIFLLNSDTLLQNNAIKMLFDFSERHQKPCVCGAWLVDKDGHPNVSEVAFPRMNIYEFVKSFMPKNKVYDRNGVECVDCVCGADMFMPKSYYDIVGGFDENIFMYGEEVEMQYRIKSMEIPRIVLAGPQIVHFGGGSSTDVSPNKVQSHMYFLKKHMTSFNYNCAKLYYTINYRIRRSKFLSNNKS